MAGCILIVLRFEEVAKADSFAKTMGTKAMRNGPFVAYFKTKKGESVEPATEKKVRDALGSF
jgi:hypothetical protein